MQPCSPRVAVPKNSVPVILALILLAPFVIAISFFLEQSSTPTVEANAGDEKVYYFLNDHLGSVDVILDDKGNVVERRDYLPYGSARAEETFNGAPVTELGFTGEHLDDETGLNYYGARYYDATAGRFIQDDPILHNINKMSLAERNAFLSNPQNLNMYSYVTNNPIKYTDPTGMYQEDVHYDLTFFLASNAGLDFDNAYDIAVADQGTDDDPETGPWASKEVRETYHFATNEQIDKLLDSAFDSLNNKEFGQALHALQDSYSHSGFGPTVGHVMFGTLPDITFTDKKRADFMAKRTFYTIRAYAVLKNVTVDYDSEAYWEETDALWKDIESKVHDFNGSLNYSDKLESLYPELYDQEESDEAE